MESVLRSAGVRCFPDHRPTAETAPNNAPTGQMFPGNRLYVNELGRKKPPKLQLVHLPCRYQEVAPGQGGDDLVQKNREPAWLLGLRRCTTTRPSLRTETPTKSGRPGSVHEKCLFYSPNRAGEGCGRFPPEGLRASNRGAATSSRRRGCARRGRRSAV